MLKELKFEEELQELQEIFSKIPRMTLEEQSKYADPNFIRVISPEFCSDLSFDLNEIPYSCWTTSMIGNIAYLALHAPVPRQRFKETLEGYARWRLNNPNFKEPEIPKKVSESWMDILKFLWAAMTYEI